MHRVLFEGRYRRAWVENPPADWKLGTLPIPLYVLLHDEHSNVDEFMADGTYPGFGRQFLELIYQPTRDELRAQPDYLVTSHQAETFALVAPEGLALGRPRVRGGALGDDECCWNSGHRGLDARLYGTDDVGFLEQMIALTIDHYQQEVDTYDPYPVDGRSRTAIDLDRIYLVGLGQGGMMAFRAACELPSRPRGFAIRGMAIFGGSIGGWFHRQSFDRHDAPFRNDPGHRTDRNPVDMPELDLLVVHGRQDLYVQFHPDTLGHDSADSLAEQDRLITDLPENSPLAQRFTPRDYCPEHGIGAWRDWFRTRCGAETVSDEVTLYAADSSPIQVKTFSYPSGRSPAGTVYIQRVIDDALGAADPADTQGRPRNLPRWEPARTALEFFRDPSTIWTGSTLSDFEPPDLTPGDPGDIVPEL